MWLGNKESIFCSGRNEHVSNPFKCRGDLDRTDEKGSTPLHIAATYGHLEALEVMISHSANLFALDNNGRTAAKVAAVHQHAEPCRFLDTLAVRWEMQNREYVEKLQEKALKDLKRRAKKASEEKKEGRSGPVKKLAYDYATAPTGTGAAMSDGGQPRSPSVANLTRKKKMTAHEALRQNFELRVSGSADDVGKVQEEAGIGDEDLGSHSAGSTFRPTPRVNAGPLLNTLQSLARQPLRIDSDEVRRGSVESGFVSQGRTASSSASEVSLLRNAQHGPKGLQQLELIPSQAFVTENDSTLATFLQSLDLMDCVQLLHREKLDLDALALCEEKDLISIGLPLGPRKKILHAVKRRKELMKNPGKLTDTEL